MLLVAVAVLFAGLGQGDIRIDAPIYAWVAKYMLQSGDWLNLYYDHGQTPYFNKPPLQFWLMAIAFKVFGASTFSAKLVSVLFGLGCVIVLYALTRLRFSREIAATAGIVLVTTYPFIRNATGARLDAAVTFFFLATLYVGTRMMRTPHIHAREWALLGALCGLGLLVKSGVGLLCLPILVVAWSWQKRWDLLLNWRIAVAFAVCAAIVLPWHWHQYAVWEQAYLNEHFRHQVMGRLDADSFGASPWYAYALEVLKRYWPWLPLSAFGLWQFTRRRERDQPMQPEDRVLMTWLIMAIVVLHLIQRKYDRYLLLVFPVLAIFAAHGFNHFTLWAWWQRAGLRNVGWMATTIVITFALLRVPLHSTKYPELAESVSAINQAQVAAGANRAAVYSTPGVGISAECAIRFYTRAKVVSRKGQRLQTGDIVVMPRAAEKDFKLPHTVIARGKTLLFARVATAVP